MQVGGSRLPRRLLRQRVVPPEAQAGPVAATARQVVPVVREVEIAHRVGPVVMVAVVAAVVSAAALAPVEAVVAAVDSAVAIVRVVAVEGRAGVATATCRAARYAPSAWTA